MTQRLKLPNFIPISLYLLSGYDSRPKILALDSFGGEISSIPCREKFITFYKKKFPSCILWLRFVDTYRFLGTNLDTEINNLTSFSEMETVFPRETEGRLLLRKGVYPYRFMDSWGMLNEIRLLSLVSTTSV